MRLAYAMTAFSDELARLLAARGWSLNELARRSNYDRGHLSRVARGLKPLNSEMAGRLGEVLGADLKAFVSSPQFGGGLGDGEHDRLQWAAAHPRHIDVAAIESLAAVLAAQRRAEDVLGSAPMLRPVKAQLPVVEDLASEARGPVRSGLLDVAAQWAQFAGWLHASTGDLKTAGARFSQALEWAAETGDTAMTGAALSWRGYIAEHAGHVGAMIGLSQAAQRDRTPMGRVYDLYQEARGYAYAGETQQAQRLAGEAASQALAGSPDQLRPWEYYYLTPGFFLLEHGDVYRLLGRRDPSCNATAIRCLADAHGQLPAQARSSEWGAVFLVHLAAAHAQDRDVAQACTVAVQAAQIAGATNSPRLVSMLKHLRAGLAARWPHEASVGELAEALP